MQSKCFVNTNLLVFIWMVLMWHGPDAAHHSNLFKVDTARQTLNV